MVFLLIQASPPKPTISISITPDYLSDGLQAAYVILTLIIVIISIWSIQLSRKQSRETLKISQAQIDKSEKQARAALEENRKQSQVALEAMYKQIEASKLQAQEAIYNQIRPIIVCISSPYRDKDRKLSVSIDMKNVGFGVASDVWGVYYCEPIEEPTDDIPPPEPLSYSFERSMIFVPQKEMKVNLIDNDKITFNFDSSTIQGYSFHPQENGGVHYQSRLVMTYSDAFNNRYLSIFDYIDEYGWKQIASHKTEHTLDEWIIDGRISLNQYYEEAYQDYLYWKEQESTSQKGK